MNCLFSSTFLTLCVLVKVLLTLKKPTEVKESPFLLFHIAHLGIDTKVRKYDMCATMYINKITMKCLEFRGQSTDCSGVL